jgi:homocysteine S-methyltransferase
MDVRDFFTNKLSSKVILLDGALGTELQRQGVKTTLPLWSAEALINNTEIVKNIHKSYILAGAQIITTNTFRTNSRAINKANCSLSSRELTLIACDLAKQARVDLDLSNIYIAGCVATLEDCYCPELVPDNTTLKNEHAELVANLVSGGVDFIFAETMNTIREAKIIAECAAYLAIPFATSFVCNDDGTLLSGESLNHAVNELKNFDPVFIGTNCAPISRIQKSVEILCAFENNFPICVYANGLGEPGEPLGWVFGDTGTEVQAYSTASKTWQELGVKIIGGCCGTTPEYIKNLKELFY